MSETEAIQFTSDNIRGWLQDETGSILTPVHEQAKKRRDDMRDAIQSVTEVSKTLLDKRLRKETCASTTALAP